MLLKVGTYTGAEVSRCGGSMYFGALCIGQSSWHLHGQEYIVKMAKNSSGHSLGCKSSFIS